MCKYKYMSFVKKRGSGERSVKDFCTGIHVE